MKVAITSGGAELDSGVEQRFGRCQYFIIVDIETMDFEAIQNPNTMAGGGAGIQSAQLMTQKGVEVVITGNCGPNAFRVFESAGIKIVTGASGTVRDSVEKFKSGKASEASSPSVKDHFGMGGRSGMGSGMGRRMRDVGVPPSVTTDKKVSSKSSELDTLKEQAAKLQNQLSELMNKIKDVENN